MMHAISRLRLGLLIRQTQAANSGAAKRMESSLISAGEHAVTTPGLRLPRARTRSAGQ